MTSPYDGSPVDDGMTPLSAQQMQSRAIRGWVWTLAYLCVIIPLTFVVNALVARLLGAEGFGQLSYLLTVLALAQGVLSLGYGAAVGRYASAHFGTGERAALLQLLRSQTSINTMWSGTTLAVVLLVLLRPTPLVGAAVVAGCFLGAYMESSSLALPAIQRSDRGAQAALVIVTAVQVASAVACVVTRDATVVFLTRFLVGMLLGPVRLLFLPRDVRRACVTFGVPRLPRAVWRFGFVGYAGALLGTLVYSRTEVLLLQWFALPAAVGVYALAFGLATQITSPIDAAIGPLTPAMTSVLSGDATAAARVLLRSYRTLLAATLMWSALTVAPLAVLIPLIYGAEFREAAPVFVIGAVASFIQSAVSPSDAFAAAIARPILPVVANGLGFVGGLAVSLATIPTFGLWGAVAGNVVGQLVSCLTLLASTARHAGIGRRVLVLFGRVVALLLVVGAVALLTTRLDLPAAVAVWLAALLVVALVVRSGRLLQWEPGELHSVLTAAPRPVRAVLRITLGAP